MNEFDRGYMDLVPIISSDKKKTLCPTCDDELCPQALGTPMKGASCMDIGL